MREVHRDVMSSGNAMYVLELDLTRLIESRSQSEASPRRSVRRMSDASKVKLRIDVLLLTA